MVSASLQDLREGTRGDDADDGCILHIVCALQVCRSKALTVRLPTNPPPAPALPKVGHVVEVIPLTRTNYFYRFGLAL